MNPLLLYFSILLSITFLSCQPAASSSEQTWSVQPVIFLAGPENAFDEVAVKDPSIVKYEGQWHLFYTARGQGKYSLGYVSAEEWEQLNEAPRMHLQELSGKADYAAAPQIFFFEPHQKWYLIYQSREANYQPVFSTTSQIGEPSSWTNPSNLLEKDEQAKWIDFWLIADVDSIHLFYTRSHEDVYRRATALDAFPTGWGPPRHALAGVHEAVHIYKVQGQTRFHMIYELNQKGERRFGLAESGQLAGPWTKSQESYARGEQLQYGAGQSVWTEEVSHGEALRTGFDQRMEYNAEETTWLIQGLTKEEHTGPYPELPWKLGLIKRFRREKE